MEHIAAFMLLVGCTQDASVCKEIPVPVPTYESMAECRKDLPLEIRLSGSTDTKVLGACKAVDASTFERSASLDWAVSRDGQLVINFDAEPQMVASR